LPEADTSSGDVFKLREGDSLERLFCPLVVQLQCPKRIRQTDEALLNPSAYKRLNYAYNLDATNPGNVRFIIIVELMHCAHRDLGITEKKAISINVDSRFGKPKNYLSSQKKTPTIGNRLVL